MQKMLTTSLYTLVCALFSISILNAQITFENNTVLATGAADLFAVDVNGDGLLDYSTNDYIQYNNGDGSYTQEFIQQVEFKVPIDLDGDGDIDFAGQDWSSNLVWWENSGNGFIKRILENNNDFYWELHPADFNGDGRMDFVVTYVQQVFNGSNYFTSWWENTGTNVLIKHSISDSQRAYPFDMDGDGDMDLVGQRAESAQNPDDNRIYWFENTGFGNFLPHLIYESIDFPGSIKPGDFNGDGKGDIVFGKPFSIYWNDGNQNFSLSQIESSTLSTITVADLDNDGKDEILSVFFGLKYFQFNGLNSFKQFNLLPESPHVYNTSDVDNDGDTDILYLTFSNANIQYFENQGVVCPAGGTITINSQAELIAFANTYTDCDNLTATLILNGGDITDLSPLNHFTTIYSLRITNCNLLMNLNGLNPDLEITDELYVAFNETLFDCKAEAICSKITSDIQNITLFNNAGNCFELGVAQQNCASDCPFGILFIGSMQDVVDFQNQYPNCKNLYADLIIVGTDFTELVGLNQIENVIGSITLDGNPSLQDLSGFDNLQSVTSGFTIAGNPSLTSLDGIENLQSVGFIFEIADNPSLSDISVLDQFKVVETLQLHGNTSLSNCAVETVCVNANYPNTLIELNSAGCNSTSEVIANCPVICPSADIVITNQADIDNLVELYPYCNNLPVSLIIDANASLLDLSELNFIETIAGDLIIDSNRNLFELTGLENLTTISGNLTMIWNQNLGNFQGLSGLTTVDGNVTIERHTIIKDMSGLESLQTIGGDLNFGDNAGLETLSGLTSLTSIGNDFLMSENDNLISTVGLENLLTINGRLFFSNNPSLLSVNLNSISTMGEFDLSGNQALYDISSLDHAVDIGSMYIHFNFSLSYCAVQAICDHFVDNTDFPIDSNGPGCGFEPEVQDNCDIDESLLCSGAFASSTFDPDNIIITMSPAPNTTGHLLSVGTTPNGTEILNNENIGSAPTYTLSGLEYSTMYFISVIGYSAFDIRTGCPINDFTTGDAPIPSCVNVTIPVDGSLDNPIYTDLSWPAVAGNPNYKVSLGTTPGGTEILNQANAGTSTSYSLPDLDPGTIYFAKITPYNATGDATTCTEISFTTETQSVPACTTLSSPINQQVDVPVNTIVAWNAVSDASGYYVTIGTNSGSVDVANNVEITNGFSFDPGLLNTGTAYYITIVPYNDAGQSVGCMEEVFFTETPTVPGCVDLVFPANGATNVTFEPQITWDEHIDADGYFFSMGTALGATDVYDNVDVGLANVFDAGTLDYNTTYYVAVVPYNNNGSAVLCATSVFTTALQSEVSIQCPGTIIVQPLAGLDTVSVFWPEPVATTTCPVGTTTITQVFGDPLGSVLVVGYEGSITYSAFDDCGNINDCSFIVRVNENPLEWTMSACSEDITVETSDPNGTIVEFTEPFNSTNCTQGIPNVLQVEGLEPGAVFPVGTTAVGYDVFLLCNDESFDDFCSFNVTVNLVSDIIDCTALSNPSNGSTDVNINPIISWNPVTDATSYLLSVGTISGAVDILDHLDVGLTTTYFGLNLEYGTTYYVTIIPFNNDGSAEGCVEESFTTENEPTVVTIECPENQTIEVVEGTTNSVFVNWDEPTFISTTCPSGNFNIQQLSGPQGGSTSINVPGGVSLTYAITDDCGGVEICSFVVGAVFVPLEFEVDCPSSITVETSDPNGAIVNYDDPSIITNCNGSTNIIPSSNVIPSGSLFPVGEHPQFFELTLNCGGQVLTDDCLFFIDVNFIPDCTNLSSPINGATNVSVNPTITWNAVNGADGYILSVGTSSGASDIVNELNVANVTTFDLSDLNFDTEYFVNILPYSSSAALGCIEESFTTESDQTTSITCTNILNPANGATNVDVNSAINWNPVTNATGYLLSIGTIPGVNDFMNELDVGNVTTFSLGQLGYNSTYYVTVTPYNDDELAMNCAEESFTTEALPTTLTVSCPQNIVVDPLAGMNMATVNWNAPTGSTTCPGGNLTATQISGDPTGSVMMSNSQQIIVYEVVDDCGNSQQCTFTVSVTENPLVNNAVCPSDLLIDSPDENGVVVTFDDAFADTNCSQGTSTIVQTAGLSSGSIFPIGTTLIEFEVSLECNGEIFTNTCSFNVTVAFNPSDCPPSIPGFTVLGEFDNHKYFISDNMETWMNASATAAANGAYLASINDASENEFIRSNLGNNIVFIGLNDATTEGAYEWDSGEAFGYNFIETQPSDVLEDFANMNFWSGGWSFDNQYVQRRYIIETTCGPVPTSLSVSCPSNVSVNIPTDQMSTIVDYDLPTYSTTCSATETVDIFLTNGLASGSVFNVGTTNIAYDIELTCGTDLLTETCQFEVIVEQSDITCPENIDGFTFLGSYNDHNYFLSNDIQSWPNAATIAAANNGYLVSMNDADENEYVRSQLGNTIAFIGLSDAQTEGDYQWQSGEPFNFNFIETPGSAPDEDYAHMNFWSGGWAFDVSFVQRPFIMEVECGPQSPVMTVDCPMDQVYSANLGDVSDFVNWTEPMAFTTCGDSNITYTQIAGPAQGSLFMVDSPVIITYEITDACGNIEVCTFSVTLESTAATLTINCPQNQVFTASPEVTSESIIWTDVTAMTTCPTQSITFSQQAGPSNGAVLNVDETVLVEYDITDDCGNSGSCSFTVTLTSSTATMNVNCPADQVFSIPEGQGSTVVNWQVPAATTNCPSNNITSTLTSLISNGSVFQVGQSEVVTYEVADECGNIQACSFTISLQEQSSACPDAIADFEFLGEFEGHKYFKALQPKRWMEAQQIAAENGGYLVSINTEAENDFIRNNISVITMIGLNDVESEGDLVWDSGEPIDFNFVETANDAEGDFGAINFWNGGWLFVNQWVQKPYIIEFSCQPTGPELTVSCIDDIVMTADPGVTSMAINWELPFASTTCPGGMVNTTQLDGSISGASFDVGQSDLIIYEFTDECDNTQICSFNVTLNEFALGFDVDCSQDIVISVDEGELGANVAFDEPLIFTNCPSSPTTTITQITGDASGSFFPIGTSIISYDVALDCGGEILTQQCTFTITVEENSAICPDQLDNFEFIGEFGGHHYFVSDISMTWAAAQSNAASLGGYLASITTLEENEFLKSNIDNIVMTGLTDQNIEGEFEWDSGEPFDFSFVTDGNMADADFGTINFWNGGWGTVNQFVQKPYIVEFSCGNTVQPRMAFGHDISINNLFPNPTSEDITIDVWSSLPKVTTVQIFDVYGKLKFEQPIDLRQGSSRISLNVLGLDEGVHFVRIRGNNERAKFVKINPERDFLIR